jgi:hypothetical protein
VALAAMVLGVGMQRVAYADEIKLHLQVKQQDPTSKTKNDAPNIEATIVDGPNVPLDKFSLSDPSAKAPVALKAINKREYTEGTDTIAIALVINGQEIWIGNDKVEQDPAAQYQGVLENLTAAIDRLKLGEAGPPGSKGVIISYSTGAEIKLAMSPLKELTGAALGSQKDYRGKIGTDMVQGITLGIAELSKATTVRKALIVVGDGHDTDNDRAKTQLKDLKDQARKQNIDLFAVLYRSAVSPEGYGVITTMIPTAKTVNSIEGIASEMTAIIERMKNRYYITFPGYDKKLKKGLIWDSKDHDLVVKIDQKELEPFTLNLSPPWKPKTSGGGFPWLAVILVVVGLLFLIIVGKAVFSKKAEPAPAPMPMPVMAAAPEAPKPAGPMKTVMLNAGGDEGGFPIVGWLVPLNGQNAYQTFRLRSGGTKIGTAPPADIVVNDGFMSTEHCQINCSPQGFTLIDNGATNGCYVNDRKVAKHDLVDNDMITLGKTNFRFKSIN